jgi:hypothetical protein
MDFTPSRQSLYNQGNIMKLANFLIPPIAMGFGIGIGAVVAAAILRALLHVGAC